ncbi:GNAT family protein [Clostridium sp. E02]|uniref:GNAT family N-acetyltransferase n=1 Tax=Clostridium sp. E02 TaxID=2487134 RepID=UPI000F541CD8|nr:GNAT family protein [Clostridium sp. E02]
MKIVTSRLELRPFTEQDINDVFEYCSQEGVGEMAGWHVHKSVVETKKILSEWIANRQKLAIVWYEGGKVIGHISIDEDSEDGREDTSELGCVLNCTFHRKGIMTEAIKAVLDHLFNHGISYVWACCFQNNLASKGMIEKCGFAFQQEGTYYAKSLDKKISSYEFRLSADEWMKCD